MGVGINVTLVPEHIGFDETEMDTEGIIARQTVIVYVLIVPSCAVTFISIVLLPTFSANEAEALPLATVE